MWVNFWQRRLNASLIKERKERLEPSQVQVHTLLERDSTAASSPTADGPPVLCTSQRGYFVVENPGSTCRAKKLGRSGSAGRPAAHACRVRLIYATLGYISLPVYRYNTSSLPKSSELNFIGRYISQYLRVLLITY